MKKASAIFLLAILSLPACAPAFADNGYRAQSQADRKGKKRRQKAQKKYAKAQRKAQNG